MCGVIQVLLAMTLLLVCAALVGIVIVTGRDIWRDK